MRLLIIEDEPGIAGFLKEGLEEEYFAVDVASDGRTGLDLAMTNEYDLLLVDWMIPGISGIEVCRRLRKEGNDVPIIFLTAKDTIEDVVFGLDAGANDYIRKPFEFEELLARIRVQLRRRGSESSKLSTGELTVDPASHQARCESIDLALTPKEFALLEFLLRNKGRVCTRSRIIEHVWDMHFDSDTSVIDVYINFLRKKLDAAGCRDLIQTIRGVGYIIRDEGGEAQ
ncbi:two component transcriptional regulator, winged helix family [Chlorobaculum parvum NCIB 8327]|uniref:Two component transcriptional regulator, winged helix family n=1 Tax=Chlorobaculum parvum (strain DSM 263 / NCIMB 8327) TaxID=517417 RepID=B3QNW5_CHLP8|nr:response regulator transcription factor [Chlorobaculum parvum]ACF11618.1 two component transcriptional regulator, winged helix family [Chlorobaculum parvum NCIB 8327]